MTSEKFIKNKTALITLIAACLVVLVSLSVRQVFGMFFIDFNKDLGISNTEFGLAIGIQMLGWGLSGPIFGAIADKYGGHKAISLAFIFYILGVYFLYAGPNTGIYFQICLGVLVGIGCGGTAISIPMSMVGKHFPLSNRTIAMSIVTAVGSFGFFLSPLFTNYSLRNNGWVDTLYYFSIFLVIGSLLIFQPLAGEYCLPYQIICKCNLFHKFSGNNRFASFSVILTFFPLDMPHLYINL